MAEVVSTVIVYNHDIVGLYNRANRFMDELAHSSSANVSMMSVFDQERLQSYLNNLRKYLSWVMASPQLDLPKTSPHAYTLELPVMTPDMDSEEIADLFRILEAGRDELINSASARQGSGLIMFDELRFVSIVDKCEAFLKTYVQVATPLDLPESSPADAMVLPGHRGV